MIILYVLLFVCGFIIGDIAMAIWILPWRKERHRRRLELKAYARFARETEMRRQQIASVRNGRTARTK